MEFIKNLSIKKIFLISCLIHLIASIFSSGFHHFDEHFQIYEFLNFKLGQTPAQDLPWEHREMVRPWIQVYFYLGIQKAISFLGIQSPFIFAFIFRLITSFFGLYSIYCFIPVLREWFKKEESFKLSLVLLNFCWYIPYIQTRTNAESMSTSLFLIGMSLFLQIQQRESYFTSFVSGVFLGASYLVRYQLALMTAFLWFWALIFKKIKLQYLAIIAVSILLMIGFGILTDYWGYGKWTFAPLNLFTSNFTDGRLEGSGVSPFWYYIKKSLFSGIPPVSLPLIIATFWGWYKKWKHPLTWATLPLFLFHSYIGHKELRYIFPVIVMCTIYSVYFFEQYRDKVLSYPKTLKVIVSINILFLVISIFRAANPSVKFYQFIWNHPEIKKIVTEVENPFTMLGLNIHYYKRENISIEKVTNFKDRIHSDEYHFFNRGHYIFKMESYPHCKSIFMAYPKWSLKFNIGNWLSRSRVWSLYKCKNK